MKYTALLLAFMCSLSIINAQSNDKQISQSTPALKEDRKYFAPSCIKIAMTLLCSGLVISSRNQDNIFVPSKSGLELANKVAFTATFILVAGIITKYTADIAQEIERRLTKKEEQAAQLVV